MPHVKSYSAIDKIDHAIDRIASERYPDANLGQRIASSLPYADGPFDSVVSFQVIEHIQDDHLFLKEIHRVLRP